jgi:hypothetical protein
MDDNSVSNPALKYIHPNGEEILDVQGKYGLLTTLSVAQTVSRRMLR